MSQVCGYEVSLVVEVEIDGARHYLDAHKAIVDGSINRSAFLKAVDDFITLRRGIAPIFDPSPSSPEALKGEQG